MLSSSLFAFVLAASIASTSATVLGVDSSQLVSEGTYSTAKGEGFTKAVIRGFEEACGVGGQVDPNFVGSYNNARAAEYTNIDAYWFPCSGSGNSCKSYTAQIAELGATFSANSMDIGRIWIDMEADSTCNNWNYGAAGNLAQAKSMVAAAQASGHSFGIYSSPGAWSTLFGSYSPVVDASAPLWFATYDDVQSLTLSTPFGGWTSAFGKQYTDVSASGDFDLNIFSS
ncbi:glycoside hydrolase family 25 protein [Athelia psychrophila]|uniref:Glycoside hydrolase family 25 protein n=1 Tax=Athelia psychrophila TaxID=1759441 RepID=A0A166WUD4_9AGAM|nr:glycoside hydrolase family 25 protein [Fibularhizoctonia sp. CBS 109695]